MRASTSSLQLLQLHGLQRVAPVARGIGDAGAEALDLRRRLAGRSPAGTVSVAAGLLAVSVADERHGGDGAKAGVAVAADGQVRMA